MKRPESLGPARLDYLLEFAESRGRFWRSKLHSYWCSGVTSGFMGPEQAAALQALRNCCAKAILSTPLWKLKEWKEDDLYREAASEMFHRDGELEIDADAKISRGDDEGAYVQAWVWVSNADLNKAA